MDDRHGQDIPPDEAVFAPARLRAGGRPPILVAGVALAIAALVGAATLDGLGRDRSVPGTAVPAAAMTAPAAVAAGVEPTTRTSRSSQSQGPPIGTATPELMKIDLRPSGGHLFVHGDVFSLEAFIVVVSLEDRGVVTATRTVSLPGGSTAFLTDANPRFQALFDMPSEPPTGSIWVRANAYDTHGDLILSLRQRVL